MKLNENLIHIIKESLKGNKLKKFLSSIEVLKESIEQGAWIPRGSIKANSGFYQGFLKTPYNLEHPELKIGTDSWHEFNHFTRCLSYGSLSKNINLNKNIQILRESNYKGEPLKIKVTDEQIIAWVNLCKEKDKAFKYLDNAKPKPKLTEIKLSKRVTTTLKEMNLDIDLSSVSYPDLEEYFVKEDVLNKKTNKLEKKKIKYYKILWPNGTKHHQSRFNGYCNCHACGKYIPSGLFVPLYATDNNSGNKVSFLLGRDCAQNIFNVKDVGIKTEKKND